MPKPGDKPHSFSWAATVAWFAVLSLTYTLSVGPFVYLVARGVIPMTTANLACRTFYGPLTWVCDTSQTFDDVIMGYTGFWRSLGDHERAEKQGTSTAQQPSPASPASE